MSIDGELSPEEEAAAHTQLVQLFEKLVPKEGKPFRQREMIVSEDRTKAIDLNRGMGDERLVKLDGEPEYRISEAGELIDPETGKPAPAKAAEYVRFITDGKPFSETMAPALDNVDLATNPERQGEARDKLVAQIKEILPSNSGESMAVIDSRAGKVLVGRDAQGGVSLAAESGEVITTTQDGKLMDQNPRASLVPVEVDPGQAVGLTERLKHGTPVELPEDPEERLAVLKSMELPISFSGSGEESPEVGVDNELSPEQERVMYADANKAIDGLHLETLTGDPDDVVVASIQRSDNGERMYINVGRDGTRYVSDSDGDYLTTESGELVVADGINEGASRPHKAQQIAEGLKVGTVVDVALFAEESIEANQAYLRLTSALFEIRFPEGANELNEDDLRIERPGGGILELHRDPDLGIETLIDRAEQKKGKTGEYRILEGKRLVKVTKKGKLKFAPNKATELAEAIRNGKQI